MDKIDNFGLMEQIQALGERERRIISLWLSKHPASSDVNKEFRERFTFGQKLADKVAAFGGSWTFIFLFLSGMLIWILYNQDAGAPFDPFPFILLNLILSCLAALQAPIIMMSQNRQAAKDRLEAHHDYEINYKAEIEIMGLHAKLDRLKDAQWADLIAQQQRQLELLEELRVTMQNTLEEGWEGRGSEDGGSHRPR